MSGKFIFTCPVCGSPLELEERRYACAERHSYDISGEGYVNLLLPNLRNSREPGDSPGMIRSRRRFLDCGHYRPLAEKLAGLILRSMDSRESAAALLDAGCGEGFYTSHIEAYLRGKGISFHGIDISREAIRLAAKSNRNVTYAVAGLFNIPAAEESVDFILNIFAPSPAAEFARILSPAGTIFHVHPGERHLLSLRQNLFKKLNPLEKGDKLETHFELQEREQLEYDFIVDGRDNIADLINMTPYAWKTGREKISGFIEKTALLETSAHFIISVYKK